MRSWVLTWKLNNIYASWVFPNTFGARRERERGEGFTRSDGMYYLWLRFIFQDLKNIVKKWVCLRPVITSMTE